MLVGALEEVNKPLIMFPYTSDLVGQKGVKILLGKKVEETPS
jgi:hypothetical protein